MTNTVWTGDDIFRELERKKNEVQDINHALNELEDQRDGVAYAILMREEKRVMGELRELSNKRYVEAPTPAPGGALFE